MAGPQLVQMFIGDGAKMVRDAFALAKEKAPAIIFIDELDAIGTKVRMYSSCQPSMMTVSGSNTEVCQREGRRSRSSSGRTRTSTA